MLSESRWCRQELLVWKADWLPFRSLFRIYLGQFFKTFTADSDFWLYLTTTTLAFFINLENIEQSIFKKRILSSYSVKLVLDLTPLNWLTYATVTFPTKPRVIIEWLNISRNCIFKFFLLLQPCCPFWKCKVPSWYIISSNRTKGSWFFLQKSKFPYKNS